MNCVFIKKKDNFVMFKNLFCHYFNIILKKRIIFLIYFFLFSIKYIIKIFITSKLKIIHV